MSEVIRLVQSSGRLRRVLSHDEVLKLNDAQIAVDCALSEFENGNLFSCKEILKLASQRMRELCPPGRMG